MGLGSVYLPLSTLFWEIVIDINILLWWLLRITIVAIIMDLCWYVIKQGSQFQCNLFQIFVKSGLFRPGRKYNPLGFLLSSNKFKMIFKFLAKFIQIIFDGFLRNPMGFWFGTGIVNLWPKVVWWNDLECVVWCCVGGPDTSRTPGWMNEWVNDGRESDRK